MGFDDSYTAYLKDPAPPDEKQSTQKNDDVAETLRQQYADGHLTLNDLLLLQEHGKDEIQPVVGSLLKDALYNTVRDTQKAGALYDPLERTDPDVQSIGHFDRADAVYDAVVDDRQNDTIGAKRWHMKR